MELKQLEQSYTRKQQTLPTIPETGGFSLFLSAYADVIWADALASGNYVVSAACQPKRPKCNMWLLLEPRAYVSYAFDWTKHSKPICLSAQQLVPKYSQLFQTACCHICISFALCLPMQSQPHTDLCFTPFIAMQSSGAMDSLSCRNGWLQLRLAFSRRMLLDRGGKSWNCGSWEVSQSQPPGPASNT